MDAIILAAGIGERLRPITNSRPKPFTPILDTPLIERSIKMLRKHAKTIYVVIKDGKEADFSHLEGITLVKQKEGYGDGAGLNALRIKNDFIMVYGDLLFDEDSVSQVSKAKGNALLCMEHSNPQNYGVVYHKNGVLERMDEKPKNPTSNLINIGVYKFTPDIFRFLDKIKLSTNTGELELVDAVSAMGKEMPVEVMIHNGMWMDIGRPWHVLEANKIILARECVKRTQSSVARNGVEIKGRAIVEDNVTIGEGTQIEGPVFIGKWTRIGKNVQIMPFSIISHSARIEDFAHIEGSLIMEDTRIGAHSRICDSILCEGVYIGANTNMVNLRPDGSDIYMQLGDKAYNTELKRFGCIVGANSIVGDYSKIMPGVKIGTAMTLASKTIVSKDIMV